MPAAIMEPVLTKTRVEAYSQGDLDALCGVYAVINAVRALCPELREDMCTALFRALVRSFDQHSKVPLAEVVIGSDIVMIKRLVGEAQTFLKRRKGINIVLKSKGPSLKSKSLDLAWKRLAEVLDDRTVIIMGLGGCCSHWTVAYDVRPRKIRLIDSYYRQKLPRKRCTLSPTANRYKLNLASACAITRDP